MNACFTNCYKYHAALHLYILKILKHWSVMRFSLIILTLFSIAASISAQKSTLMVPAREAYCRIPVMACGEALARAVDRLPQGAPVRVQGFISRANFREGEYRLVLHAAHIDILNTESSKG